MKTCSKEGCNNKHHAKGYCKIHYNKLLPRRTDICSVDGCNKPVEAKGMCSMHRSRLKRNGTLEESNRVRTCHSLEEKYYSIDSANMLTHEFIIHNNWTKACKQYYGDHCTECGWDETTCDVHHVIPRSKGGKNTIENAIMLCPNCHAKRHRRPPIHRR